MKRFLAVALLILCAGCMSDKERFDKASEYGTILFVTEDKEDFLVKADNNLLYLDCGGSDCVVWEAFPDFFLQYTLERIE